MEKKGNFKRNNYNNRKSQKGDETKGFSDTQRRNDPSFYLITPKIRDAVANVPFSVFPGTRETQPLNATYPSHTFRDVSNHATPGVFALRWLPTFGSNGESQATALNVAAKALYTFVRHQNSGHANYESADLMLYILAMDSIYTGYHDIKRMLALTKQYELVNRNTPALIAQALGFDLEDAQKNYAIYRAKLNLLAAKISALAVPNVFTLFKRHTAITSVILTDSTSLRSQYYVYTPKSLLKYNPIQAETGGGLDVIPWNDGTSVTITSLITKLEGMLDVILSDEDCNIMSGDLLKAYGRDALYVIKELDEFETCPIVFDEAMLEQIENTHTLAKGAPSVSGSFGQVVQDQGMLTQILTTGDSAADENVWANLLAGATYFNSHKEDVSTDDVVEYTRNTLGVVPTGAGGYHIIPGSELIYECTIYSYAYLGTTPSVQTYGINTIMSFAVNPSDCIKALVALSKFDWHPLVYIMQLNENIAFYHGVLGDLKKYTLLSNEQRTTLNDICVTGELGGLILSEFNKRSTN